MDRDGPPPVILNRYEGLDMLVTDARAGMRNRQCRLKDADKQAVVGKMRGEKGRTDIMGHSGTIDSCAEGRRDGNVLISCMSTRALSPVLRAVATPELS
jgi:hypothetical protein